LFPELFQDVMLVFVYFVGGSDQIFWLQIHGGWTGKTGLNTGIRMQKLVADLLAGALKTFILLARRRRGILIVRITTSNTPESV
jgi:hypothetical protein